MNFQGGFEDEDMPLRFFADYRVTGSSSESDWVNFYESLSPISDLMMFPAGVFEGKVEIRFYCEDAIRARSTYIYIGITVSLGSFVCLFVCLFVFLFYFDFIPSYTHTCTYIHTTNPNRNYCVIN